MDETQDDPHADLRAEIAAGMAQRFRDASRAERGIRVGAIDFDLMNAMALDPVEGWRLGEILGAQDVAGMHEAGALDFWPGHPEPVIEFAFPDRAIFVGRYSGRAFDTVNRAWAKTPVDLLCRLMDLRPGQAAYRIARAFGLEAVPHVG